MKHLRIARKGNKLRIIHQTYRGSELWDHSFYFAADNGFTLFSDACPELGHDCNSLYLRGDDITADHLIVELPDDEGEYLERLREAVRDYNNWR